jgi:hypothetical protein
MYVSGVYKVWERGGKGRETLAPRLAAVTNAAVVYSRL